MTITIVPEPVGGGKEVFRAMAGAKEAVGATAGAALDALTAELPDSRNGDASGTLVLIQRFRPDRFFTAAQRDRLAELMAKWRAARDAQVPWSAEEQVELEELVRAETLAMAERAEALVDGKTK